MTNTTEITTDQPRAASAAIYVPPLLDRPGDVNPELAAIAAQVRLDLAEFSRRGREHTKADGDDTPEGRAAFPAIDDAWNHYIDEFQEKSLDALFDAPAFTRYERHVRAIAVLRALALYYSRDVDWGSSSIVEVPLDIMQKAASGLMSVGEDLAGVIRGLIQPDPVAVAIDASAWTRAATAYAEAMETDAALLRAVHIAEEHVEAEAPKPEILTRGALFFGSEAEIENFKGIKFDDKVAMIQALREWRPRRDAAEASAGLKAAEKAWDAYDGRGDTFRALIDAPADSLETLRFKVEAIIREGHCDYFGDHPERPETLERMLADSAIDGAAPIARLYQDLLRMTGGDPALIAAKPFDVAAWVEAFEAIPGHKIDERGPVYSFPAAYGPDFVTDAETTVSDPERIRAYHDRVAARSSEHAAYIEQERREKPGYDNTPAPLHFEDQVNDWFHDDPAEAERLIALIQKRRGQERAGPIGAKLWRAEPAWRQDAIRAFARRREA